MRVFEIETIVRYRGRSRCMMGVHFERFVAWSLQHLELLLASLDICFAVVHQGCESWPLRWSSLSKVSKKGLWAFRAKID